MPDWQEILRRDGPAVWQTAYRLLNHRADAEECFQETFLLARRADEEFFAPLPSFFIPLPPCGFEERMNAKHFARLRQREDFKQLADAGN